MFPFNTNASFSLSANREINVAVMKKVYWIRSYRVVFNRTFRKTEEYTSRQQPLRLTIIIELAGGVKTKTLVDIR
ncbi:MAG: hypothetical protein ACQJCO_05330 [cyanobacterium endosymbiont of Rhopalodia sterrenbergii]